MNLPKSETFFKERDIYYKGEGVPLIGSGNKTGGGSPPAQPCLEVTLHEPSENPMTSVVGVRQIKKGRYVEDIVYKDKREGPYGEWHEFNPRYFFEED